MTGSPVPISSQGDPASRRAVLQGPAFAELAQNASIALEKRKRGDLITSY
jgi:hypothetical protein